MKGFAVDLEKIIKGMPLDITIQHIKDKMFSYKEIEIDLKKVSNVDFILPSIEMNGIIKSGENSNPVKLWAIPLSNLPKNWEQYFYPFITAKKSRKPGVFLGCNVYIADLNKNTNRKAKFLTLLPSSITLPIEVKMKITGRFCTGLYEYDDFYIVTDLSTFQKFLGVSSINRVYIQLKNAATLRETAEEIRQKMPRQYYVSSWTYQKRSLLTAVEVERNITQIIIMLILITTGFGFGSILYILVVNKTKEIGYLKSLGMDNRQIFSIFIIISFIVSILGSLLGSGAGYLFAKNINGIAQFLEKYTGFKLFPPQEYMFYSIPYFWSWSWMLFVSLLNISILVIAALLPAYKAANLNPAYTLKNE